MIADDFDDASVLFADIVGFTPMSAEMTPPQLVGLLNTVFSAFDGFVAELGLEKIKISRTYEGHQQILAPKQGTYRNSLVEIFLE